MIHSERRQNIRLGREGLHTTRERAENRMGREARVAVSLLPILGLALILSGLVSDGRAIALFQSPASPVQPTNTPRATDTLTPEPAPTRVPTKTQAIEATDTPSVIPTEMAPTPTAPSTGTEPPLTASPTKTEVLPTATAAMTAPGPTSVPTEVPAVTAPSPTEAPPISVVQVPRPEASPTATPQPNGTAYVAPWALFVLLSVGAIVTGVLVLPRGAPVKEGKE